MQEIFKDIPGYEGLYQVSNLGGVKSLPLEVNHWMGGKAIKKEQLLKPALNKGGYLLVVLTNNRKRKTITVHKLVAMAFLNHKPCGHKMVVNHINFNRQDNTLENLEIVTTRVNGNKAHLKSTSKYVGVCWDKRRDKWMANIHKDGKTKFLGYFHNEVIAHLAYEQALTQL